ncbi:hypothetical protein [Methylobacterium brachiatum]|uniref:hypothetical protein n=1 Tax=Methylobacterium brachiatum TaxID=269660 RepID=UPI000EFA74BF|nr:hypothetical protein [Methylobacterium brachiatum]AYO86659.1 hypothetical protein EBB05_30360 [Methylobacterium brachiatum]
MKTFCVSAALAIAAVLLSQAPASAAERMIAIYAGPSGISIPVSALVPAPAQPAVESAPVTESTRPLAIIEAGGTRRVTVVHTASTSLK